MGNELDQFHLDNLRPVAGLTLPLSQQTSPKPPRHAPGERFLKGPIPLDWLVKAMALPGEALSVALLIWHAAGWRKKRTFAFSASSKTLPPHLSRKSVQRAIHALEGAGLISVIRKPGHALLVTLNTLPQEKEPADPPESDRRGGKYEFA
jgi:hypothetical protein